MSARRSRRSICAGRPSGADAVVNGADWYEENDVELLSGKSVMSLDAGERVAKIQGGEEVRFGKALLGTGAMVNILRVDGAELDGIHYLRAFGNSDAIREEAKQAKRAVLIGGSYIGCEVAASLVEMGVECTIVMLEDVALSTGFGEEAGRFFQGVLESKGVEFVGGASLGVVRGRWARSEGRDRGRARDRVRLLRGWRGRAAGRDAGAARRARGRRRDRLRRPVADVGRGDLRGGRLLLVRQRGARSPAAGRALGRGAPAGAARGEGDARQRGAVQGDPVLLQRPERLDGARVRRARRRTGTRSCSAARWTTASFRPGTSRTARSPERSRWAAPRTSCTPER